MPQDAASEPSALAGPRPAGDCGAAGATRIAGRAGSGAAGRQARPGEGPGGLLRQMEELMAALDADLSRLDAELQSATEHPPADGSGPRA